MAEEFAATQEGTVHFHYLLPENGGFLHVARSIAEHVTQLAAVMRDPASTRAQTERFVQAFLRPHGLDVPCTPILADALQRVASTPRAPAVETFGDRVARVLAWPLAVLLHLMSLGESSGKVASRAAHKGWNKLGKTSRLVLKRLVVQPLRGVRWVLRRLFALARRGMRQFLYWTLTAPRRLLRLFRQVRYYVAVRIRGNGQA
jgi:hypothetical protein